MTVLGVKKFSFLKKFLNLILEDAPEVLVYWPKEAERGEEKKDNFKCKTTIGVF